MTLTVERSTRVSELAAAADRIRHHVLDMGQVQGQGYVGQGLGFADVLAVVYKDLANYRPQDPEWVDRDRVLLSMGHYAIALDAALAEAGTIPVEELDTYGSDDSRLPMSGMSTYTPGMEISGGSLGHGLGHLLCVVDMNGLQADGPTKGVLRTEPVQEKCAAFGWRTARVNGNDIAALVEAFDSVPASDGRPAVVICDTRIGSGVPFLEAREKAHFMRIDENEWDIARAALSDAAPRAATTTRSN
jgi:transketolase